MTLWIPHQLSGRRVVHESSCCEEFILCSEGASFFVIRRDGNGGFEETARGVYGVAFSAWLNASAGHKHEAKTA